MVLYKRYRTIAAQEAKKAVETVQAGKKADFKVSIGVGSSKSASSSETTQITHQGSTLNAGQVNLTATDGDIAVLGSTIQAAEKVSLDAAKSLQLTSVQDIERQRSQNSNSGWSAGVFAGVNGGSPGFGVEGAIQKGKGHENSNSVIQRNTTVQGQAVQLRSGEDTALKGAVVTGDKVNVEVGNNLVVESRQDSQQYDSKQSQGGVSAGVSVIGSGSYASVNGSLNQGKLNYAQVETQSGLHAGEAGLTVNVAGNAHLKGAIVDSQASQEKNRFTTGSLTSENIENHSEAKVESIGGGLSTDPTQNIVNGLATGLSALGNINKQDSSTTHSAVGSNIQLTTQQGDIPTALARDTKAANEQVEKTEIADLKTRQEMAQVIGEIANNGITIVLKPKLDEAERQKAEAEAILKNDANNQAAKQQLETANKTIKDYGQGSQIQLAVRAVTGVLQGIATGEATQAAVGGLSPYANYAIKKATTDKAGNVNTEANLMAHALLGAVEAYATGNNATAGAAGAVGGELAAKIITEQLYQKTPEQLTEAQKQTVTALSQLASGLAGGLISDSTAGAINAAEIGKRAVEDNYLSMLSQNRRDALREKIKNGQASQKEITEFLQLEKADQTSDYLVEKALHHPEAMTSQERTEYENYAKHYISESIQNREVPQDIEHNLKEILTGNYYKGYGYAYALDEKYRSSLPSRWFISDTEKSAEEKMYENLNAKYIQNPKTFNESFDGKVASSTREGLELAASIYSGNIVTEAGLSVLNKLGFVGKQIASTAEKYPLVADISATAIANTGYQLSQNQTYDPYSLLQSELSTVLTRGRTVGQQISINVGISSMATQNSNDYGWNALGAVIGTLGNSTINKVSLKNPFLNSLSSGVTSEILGDSETLKKYFNNAYKEEYEKK